MQKSQFLAFLTGCAILVFGLQRAHANEDWNVVSVNNREYVSLENIARFYQLQGDAHKEDRHVILGDSRVRIETLGDPRQVEINGVRQWLSFPMIVQNGQLLVSRFDLAKTIEPSLRPTMIQNLAPIQTVVLDAGHGGNDKGAKSVSGFEKDYTLSVIRFLKRSLEAKGLHVLLTRDTDIYVPLEARAERVNEIKDSILVSVHFNSSNDGGLANGFEVFSMTPRGAASSADTSFNVQQLQNDPGNDFDNAGLALANCVHHSLLGHLTEADRGVKRARFVVLKDTHAPSVLIEGGFLTNGFEGARIDQLAWRQKLAEAIAQGVRSYIALADTKVPPKLLADYRAEQLPLTGTIVRPDAVATQIGQHTDAGGLIAVSNDEATLQPQSALNQRNASGQTGPAER